MERSWEKDTCKDLYHQGQNTTYTWNVIRDSLYTWNERPTSATSWKEIKPGVRHKTLVGDKRVFSKLWVPPISAPIIHVKGRSQRHHSVGKDAADKDSIGKSTVTKKYRYQKVPLPKSTVIKKYRYFKLVEYDGPITIANPKNTRQSTALHREVTDVNNRTLSRLAVITPPQDGQEENAAQSDVNAVGPGGLTPLTPAVSRGNYLDGTVDDDKEGDDSGGQVISESIQFGARIDSRSENLKETALHLAARHACADSVKRLLDAGADASARDKTGRTPLHLAVTADAQEVFQILLQHRVTELDAQSDDGTTPLIFAARFNADDIVEELIKAGAKLNLTDKQGKTALHWTASVNNEKATRLLLKNNAEKDVQDSKGQTPLFLASKEGNASVVKMLLSSCANRRLADNMDQSPLDIARKRNYADVVKLLSDSYSCSTLCLGNQMNCETPAVDFNMIEPSLDLDELAMFWSPFQGEQTNDLNNDFGMYYGMDERSQGGAAETCVRYPSELIAWNHLEHTY